MAASIPLLISSPQFLRFKSDCASISPLSAEKFLTLKASRYAKYSKIYEIRTSVSCSVSFPSSSPPERSVQSSPYLSKKSFSADLISPKSRKRKSISGNFKGKLDYMQCRHRPRDGSSLVFGWFGGGDKETQKAEEEEEGKDAEKEEEQRKKKISKLVLSLMVDTVGLLVDKDFLEFDFAWSGLAAFLIQRMYRAPLLTSVGLLEQTIPTVKYLPTATIGWAIESVPQLEWITRLPFMGGLAKAATQKKPWWPFGK